METYFDADGQERCDFCTELIDGGCDCVCDVCGDSVEECACDESDGS